MTAMINEPPVAACAPGRVELLGNHTDYNEGYVLSAAIDRGITIKGSHGYDRILWLNSTALKLSVQAELDGLRRSNTWADYPLGVVKCLLDAGFPLNGFTAEITSDLPVGAGLSSSAAVEVATATFLVKLFNLELEPMALAKLCRKAENEFVGMNCGLLDQVSSVFGKKGNAIFLDCRNETVENVPFPEDLALLITLSGVKHALVAGEYNERREQCLEAARLLGVRSLRDVTLDRMRAARDTLPALLFKRALHIVGENDRVVQGVAFLKGGEAERFGKLMFESHESSRFNFENSAPELDDLVIIASREEGVLGSRLTGGGFGGSTVSLIRRDAAAELTASIGARYKERTGNESEIYLCEIADGAHLV